MEKHRKLLLIVVILFGSLTLADMVYVGMNKTPAPPLQKVNVEAQEPSLGELINLKQDILSPDGKATLKIENTEEVQGTVHQIFSIFTEKNTTPKEIFSVDSPKDNLVTVPFNTFSPPNKYFYLKSLTSIGPIHMVFRTDGEDIVQDHKYVEIETRFYEKHPDFVVTDITGWGGYSLIVVNTNDKDGKVGPSWWFDLSNFSFIRLNTRFN